jgi:hypothetical protein
MDNLQEPVSHQSGEGAASRVIPGIDAVGRVLELMAWVGCLERIRQVTVSCAGNVRDHYH